MRAGFTLIELIVVLVIIGIIYALAATLVRQPEAAAKEAMRFAPDRLDRALRGVEEPGYLRLVCTGQRCEACRLENRWGEPIGEPMRIFESPPVVYAVLQEGSPQATRTLDGPCFVMERFENQAVSETLFEYENRFYHYPPLLQPMRRYSSLDEAWERIEPGRNLPSDRSRYFHEEE